MARKGRKKLDSQPAPDQRADPIRFPRSRKWEYLSRDGVTVSTDGIPAAFRLEQQLGRDGFSQYFPDLLKEPFLAGGLKGIVEADLKRMGAGR